MRRKMNSVAGGCFGLPGLLGGRGSEARLHRGDGAPRCLLFVENRESKKLALFKRFTFFFKSRPFFSHCDFHGGLPLLRGSDLLPGRSLQRLRSLRLPTPVPGVSRGSSHCHGGSVPLHCRPFAVPRQFHGAFCPSTGALCSCCVCSEQHQDLAPGDLCQAGLLENQLRIFLTHAHARFTLRTRLLMSHVCRGLFREGRHLFPRGHGYIS